LTWTVSLQDDFAPEYDELPEAVQNELLAVMGLLEKFGPQLSRPHVYTLKGSRHADVKELRFDAADGVWRFLFAFDPKRTAIMFFAVATNRAAAKSPFYRRIIAEAAVRFDSHLRRIEAEKEKQNKKGK
jgi:hypothetical protein